MNISSSTITLLLITFTAATEGAKTGKSAKSKAGKSSKSSVPEISKRCEGVAPLMCNDFVAYEADERGTDVYKFTWGKNIPHMDGAQLMSSIPKLPLHLSDKLGDPKGVLPNGDRDLTDPIFMNTLKAIGKQPGLGPSTFGDSGYDNPGEGGVADFDIFVVENDLTLEAFGQYYRKDLTAPPKTSCNPKSGKPCFNVRYSGGYGTMDQAWWSLSKDSEGLTTTESKDQVSQVCWGDGKSGSGTIMDQAIRCTFGKGTKLMVGEGLWRATSDTDPLTGIASEGNICDKTDISGHHWANPQKVLKPDVYQYLIPMGTEKKPINVDVKDCYVCTVKALTSDTFKNMEKSDTCWKVDDFLVKA